MWLWKGEWLQSMSPVLHDSKGETSRGNFLTDHTFHIHLCVKNILLLLEAF